jgi:hypothetical protein
VLESSLCAKLLVFERRKLAGAKKLQLGPVEGELDAQDLAFFHISAGDREDLGRVLLNALVPSIINNQYKFDRSGRPHDVLDRLR